MHDTAYRIGGLVLQTYCDLATAKVLEVGSFDVNGSLRKHALPSTDYVGVDIEEGPGVDALIEIGKPYPFSDETFDLVMASSVFEHDPAFWMTFIEMCRKTKAGGHIYISAPANGTVHRYPQDNWRFYPDAGLALARWAQSQGQEVELVESFVADRQGDVWNDFCAVFRKGPSATPLCESLISFRVPCSNVHTWQSSVIYNPRETTEDMEIISTSRNRITELESELALMEQRIAERHTDLENDLNKAIEEHSAKLRDSSFELEQAEQGQIEAKRRIDDLEVLLEEAVKGTARRDRQLGGTKLQIQELLAERQRLDMKLTQADQELVSQRDRITDLENNLCQRQEEIEQGRSELWATQEERNNLLRQLGQLSTTVQDLESKLAEADAWLFKLSGDRRAAEGRLLEVNRALGEEKGQRSLADATVLRSARQIIELKGEFGALQEALEGTEKRLGERHQNIMELVDQLQLREEEIQANGERFQSDASQRDAVLLAAQRQAAQLEMELRRLTEQNVALEQDGRAQNVARELSERRLHWLSTVDQVLTNMQGWRNFMPPRWRRQWALRVLRRNGLFDPQAYLAHYPDVAQAGMDPLQHYILHGIYEGRVTGAQAL